MKKNRTSQWIILSFLILSALLIILPFYLMLATATKSRFEFAANFWGMRIPPQWGNFTVAWSAIYRYVMNTLSIAAFTLIGTTVISLMVGYTFAKRDFKGKEFLFMLLLAFQMVPAALLMIPQFINVYKLGLYNTHAGVILPAMAGAVVPSMLVRSFVEGIPDSIFESVRMDGANEWTIIVRIVLPLTLPAVGTNALFCFIGSVNAYTWPLIILSDDRLKTITIGLNSLAGEYGVNYGVQMAAYTLICIPMMVLIVSTMRLFVSGLTAGAVKE